MRSKAAPLAILCVTLLALVWSAPARAQYFGRNAVQWEHFKFETLKTEHFDIYYYPEEQQAAEDVGRMAERWYARLSRILGHKFNERQPIILYASHPHFQQTNTLGGPPGEGTGGVTEAFKRRIVLPVGGSLAETDHVLGHELVHAFQYSMTGQGRISDTNYPAALRMPLWFIEGMAEYLSVGPIDPHTAMWLRDAARRDRKLPSVHDLGSTQYFPYRWGQALWAYLAQRYGDSVFSRCMRAIGPRTNDAETVLKEVLKIDEKTLTKDWHAAVRAAYGAEAADKKDPDDYGEALVTEKKQGGRLNLGPVLSPDGSEVAFLSEREQLSVELFLADTRSGHVTKQLSRAVVDPHLESLQFINSAGAWDRGGKRFALGAIVKGRPALLMLDTVHAGEQREIPFPGLGEVYTPSFSPDGAKVAFSALAGGFTDLYVYDLNTKQLKRLTQDAYADLQPAWSPDGHTIAFVTDRFSTKLDTLDTGNYRLASFDLSSEKITPLPGFENGKNIDPQWSRDGSSLYFLSDQTGITNIYRLEAATGKLYQVTDLSVGVSGITPLSPALSSAADADRIAYSAYDDGRYEIYAVEDHTRLAGWPVPQDQQRYAGVIPGGKAESAVVEAREDATTGLADASAFTKAPYKPKLKLDYIGQPYLIGGADRYGAFFGGGISMSFSDMLGNHSLSTVVQADNISGFNNFGGIVGYINREHRLNWGVEVAQVPYVAAQLSTGFGTISGQDTYLEQTLTYRQLERSISGVAFYPFDSATRVEFGAGYRGIGFDQRVETLGYSLQTGQQVLNDTQTVSSPSIHLGQGTVALVRDTSVFGPTSPILGQRFRVDVTPTFGTLNYAGTLLDFRQYFMPVRPITLAARLLHYGRYGSGGEDIRLTPLFLGYPSLVRGYDSNTFSISECGNQADGTCPVFDRLLGSRMLVGNFELRAPLLGLFGAKNLYGPIPVEVGGFFDAGVAWDSNSSPKLFGGERQMVKSIGATARLNLLGFAVFQIDRVKPLDRPGKNAYWSFNLLAGF